MSDLYPVIEDIISLLNNKYGTDISAENFSMIAYTPKLDENKKEFTSDDIKWLLQQLKSHSFSGGVKGLVKRMGDKFNNDLKQTIYDASRKFGDLEGVVKFLIDYDKMKNKLPRGKSPAQTAPAQRIDIAAPVKKVKIYLEKVKKEYPKEYKGSFFEYTDKVLSKIQKYQRVGERFPKLEREILGLFVGNDDNQGLIKGWRRLKVKGVSDAIKDIYNKLAPYSDKEEIKKKDIIDPPKESPLAPLEKEVRHLSERPSKVEDKEMELNKEMKGEKRKKVKEIIKEIPGENKYNFSLKKVKEYLKKAKSSFPKDFDQYSLHKYTDDLVSVMEDYYGGRGRDIHTNKKINSLFNESPGITLLWDEIHKPFAKNLRALRSSFATQVKTKKEDISSVEKSTLLKLEKLSEKTNLSVTDNDKTIAKALLGKKERKYLDEGTAIDPTFFNKLVKELVKHKDDLPKKPDAADLSKLNLSKEELETAKTKEYMSLVGETLNMVDRILQDNEDVSDDDLVSKVIKKFKDDDIKTKEKQKQDRKVVLDRNLKKEQEDDAKKIPSKQKESSINIVGNYKTTLFYKLERLANMSEDKLVKAEIEDITQEIKQIL